MKKLLLTLGMTGLLVGCGETTNINGLTEDDVERILSERGADTVYVVGGDTVEVRDTVSVTDTVEVTDTLLKVKVRKHTDTVVVRDTVKVKDKPVSKDTVKPVDTVTVVEEHDRRGNDSLLKDTSFVVGGTEFGGYVFNSVFYDTTFYLAGDERDADKFCQALPGNDIWRSISEEDLADLYYPRNWQPLFPMDSAVIVTGLTEKFDYRMRIADERVDDGILSMFSFDKNPKENYYFHCVREL